MRTALVIRHVHFEDLGSFAAPLAAAGHEVRYVDAGLDDLRAEELVLLGGPIGAYEGHLYPFLDDELDALRARLAAGAPTLGICLGAQLMAAALGARVAPGPAKEIGWATVELTEAGQAGPLHHLDGVPVLHWHGTPSISHQAPSASPPRRSVPTRLSSSAATHSASSST